MNRPIERGHRVAFHDGPLDGEHPIMSAHYYAAGTWLCLAPHGCYTSEGDPDHWYWLATDDRSSR